MRQTTESKSGAPETGVEFKALKLTLIAAVAIVAMICATTLACQWLNHMTMHWCM